MEQPEPSSDRFLKTEEWCSVEHPPPPSQRSDTAAWLKNCWPVLSHTTVAAVDLWGTRERREAIKLQHTGRRYCTLENSLSFKYVSVEELRQL